MIHLIGGLIVLGYAQNYYFHLRTSIRGLKAFQKYTDGL